MTAPWKSVTHVGEAEIHRLDPPETRKHGPLVAIEYDAYVDFDGLRFWRELHGHDGGITTRRRGYGDEVWWFADGPVSAIVKDYGDRNAQISTHFSHWHGGHAYNLASREEAFAAAVEGAREDARTEVRKAKAELAEARRVEKLVRA